MARFPSVFVSHGSPSFILEQGPAFAFLQGLGPALGRPDAILCVSAHWDTRRPAVSAATAPETIHDFWGFPDALYRLRYPAPGSPETAARVKTLLDEAGLGCVLDPGRGLDHGSWTPLAIMYPEADIPCLQLSVQSPLGPGHHLALGRALAPLKHAGVLILASGTATHNLRDFGRYDIDAPPPGYVSAFSDWLVDRATAGDLDAVAGFHDRAPHARRNHPSDEHFLPMIVAMAAGDSPRGRLLHQSYSWGMMSMASFAFD